MSQIFHVRGHNLLKDGCQTAFFFFKLGIKHAKQNSARVILAFRGKMLLISGKLSLWRVVFNEAWNLELIFKTLKHLLPQPTLQLLQGLQNPVQKEESSVLVFGQKQEGYINLKSINLILSRHSSSSWHEVALSPLKYEADS